MDRTGRPEANDMGEASLGPFNLARSPLASELGHDLIDVRDSGCPKRMPLGEQAPH